MCGLSAARQHLFVAALGNNTVEVLDTAKGTHLRSLTGFHEPQGMASIDIVGDTDDLFDDTKRQRLYVSGGDGYLDVVQGARTTLFDLLQDPIVPVSCHSVRNAIVGSMSSARRVGIRHACMQTPSMTMP